VAPETVDVYREGATTKQSLEDRRVRLGRRREVKDADIKFKLVKGKRMQQITTTFLSYSADIKDIY